MLLCSVGHAFIVFSVSRETKDSVMRQDSEHVLSVLKSNSFVLKWKRVVSVLSPLSLFSRGGSHFKVVPNITSSNFEILQNVFIANR